MEDVKKGPDELECMQEEGREAKKFGLVRKWALIQEMRRKGIFDLGAILETRISEGSKPRQNDN